MRSTTVTLALAAVAVGCGVAAADGAGSVAASDGWARAGAAPATAGAVPVVHWRAADGAAPGVGADGVAQDGDDGPGFYDDTVVRDVDLTFDRADWLALLGCERAPGMGGPGGGASSIPRVDVPAELVVDGVTIGRVGVHCKGNSTLNAAGTKKPLNVTTDAFVPGLSIGGIDVVNFNNNWNDPTQLREALALRLLGAYMPVSRFTFVRLTVNGAVVGLYTAVEQVNGEWAQGWYDEDDGLVVKGDSPTRIAFDSSPLTWQGEDLRPYKAGYEVKGKAAAGDAGYEALRELIRALSAPVSAGGLSDTEFAARIGDALDVDSALWYLAGNNLITNFDSYYVGKNYYLYRGERDGRWDVIPWDLGLSFGLFGLRAGGMRPGGGGGGQAGNPITADPFAQANDANRPLIRRLLAVPSFKADYVAHYRALRDEVFHRAWLEEVGQAYQDLVRPAAAAEVAAQGDLSGAYSLAQFEANLRDDVDVGAGGFGGGVKPGVLALVDARRAHLATLPALASPDVRLAAHGRAPEAPTAADAVALTAAFDGADAVAGVEVRYRVRGGAETTQAMARGDDGRWTAVLPPQRAGRSVTYALRVGLADGRAVFFPSANQTAPYRYEVGGVELPRGPGGDLVINEVMASNATTHADEAGEFEDWVEVYNRGAAPIDLAGYTLSDDPSDPFAFRLPSRSLGPGEHLVIWCDGDLTQGPLHAPFRLDKDGGSVVLADAAHIVDQIDTGVMATDISLGRSTDGAETWDFCARPTPGRANACRGALPVPARAYLPWGGR